MNYYTPEIEEFHEGFKYELLNYQDNWISVVHSWKQSQWILIKGSNDLRLNIEDNLKRYRVKYLDKEDIESLGFQEIGQEEYYLNGDLNSWCIKRFSSLHTYSWYRINSADKIWNVGLEIKNKSELKKLMKQLNIQ